MDDNESPPADSKKLLFQNFIVNVKETPQFGRMFSLFNDYNIFSRPSRAVPLFSSPSSSASKKPIGSEAVKNSAQEDSSFEDLLASTSNFLMDNGTRQKSVQSGREQFEKIISRETANSHNDSNTQSEDGQMCRYYQNGFCLRESLCHFSHGDNPTKATLVSPSQFGTLQDCTGQIYLMCLDQHGCRFLQKELDVKDPRVTDKIFNEVVDHIVELMSDPFGNYLCQKLLDLCTPKQRFMVLDAVSESLVDISTNIHGTRAVQKLIEVITTDLEFNIVRQTFKHHVVMMIQDLNGNHVIQKCLQKMIDGQQNQFIYDSVALNCVEITTHRHGCCVFQRCIDFGTPNQRLQLVETVKHNALTLIKDPFGNYAVQYIIDLKIPNLPADLIKRFQGHIYQLAKQKFSSNVIEKCLKAGNSVCVKRVMSELLFDTNSNLSELNSLSRSFLKKKAQEQLFDLLQDCFGNYVVQTCLTEGITKSNREYMLMVELLVPFYQQLKSAPYGRKVLSHLEAGMLNNQDQSAFNPSMGGGNTMSPRQSYSQQHRQQQQQQQNTPRNTPALSKSWTQY